MSIYAVAIYDEGNEDNTMYFVDAEDSEEALLSAFKQFLDEGVQAGLLSAILSQAEYEIVEMQESLVNMVVQISRMGYNATYPKKVF